MYDVAITHIPLVRGLFLKMVGMASLLIEQNNSMHKLLGHPELVIRIDSIMHQKIETGYFSTLDMTITAANI